MTRNKNIYSKFYPTIKFPNVSMLIKENEEYKNINWKNKLIDIDGPNFIVLSNKGVEVVNLNLSMYKGSLYFDANENYSIYISGLDIDFYAGVNYKKGIGIDVSANVAEIGYDGRVVDASIEGFSFGFAFMYKDGKLVIKNGYGLWGWSVAIDFEELFK